MDEIIYLESDEEITSVIDKIKASKSSRLVLVVPREATILQSVVNLKLLIREAEKSSKEIALVTADKIGRNLASQVGLTVYDSLKSERPQSKFFQPPPPSPKEEEVIEIDMRKEQPTAQKPPPKGVQVHHFQEESKSKPISAPLWRKPETPKKINWPKTKKILWPMITVIILLILIGGFLVLPKTNVKIKVKAENFQKTMDMEVSLEATNVDKPSFTGNFLDLIKEKEGKFPATGKKNLGGKATGTLTLYNYWDSSPQSFGAGTKFSSSSKTFVSKNSATVPGTSIKGGNIVPGTTTADIEAENPGDDYNVKAGRFTIVEIPAAQQEKIYGQSSKDLAGGFTKEVTVVSENDFNQARDGLAKELSQDLQKELTDKSSGMEILEKAVLTETVEAKSSADIDAEASDFTLKVKERLRAMVFPQEDFEKFVLLVLEKQIPYDKMVTLGPNDSITPAVKETKYDQQILSLLVNVQAKISYRVDKDRVKKDLLGKSKTAASQYLSNLSGIDGFQMNFTPSFWLKRIPNFSRSLKVELEYIEPTPTASPTPTVSPQPSPEVSP